MDPVYQAVYQALLVVVVSLAAWLVPSMTVPTLAFGVRVPTTHLGHSAIQRARRVYRLGVSLIGIVAVAWGCLAVRLWGGWTWLGLSGLFLALVGQLVMYLVCHDSVRRAKRREGWFAGQRQVIAVDTEWLPSSRPKVSMVWALPALAVLVAGAVLAGMAYPSLPDPLPIHFDLQGHPNGWAHKSFLSVFSPVLMGLGLTLLMGVIIAMTQRAPLRTGSDAQAAGREWAFTCTIVRGLWLLAACVNAVFVGVECILVTGTGHGQGVAMAAGALPLLVVVLLVVVTYRSARKARGQGSVAAFSAAVPAAPHDDDRFWLAGVIYFNRDDPAVLVPKRFGVGWTLNMARPGAWGLLAAIVAVPLLLVVLGIAGSR
ncbi:DUF1648 domain-containing protein [Alicyclobacillus shizuokensis]|uniref:DUF1648 domain-containing protein n=1 Tax=Alicyclobacillus shizuokensis TaxID=392014 RepID=UPI0008340716|nr:DUF5808 domain-containing protein [Alicyclobacillus shizuokensis]